MKALIVCFSVIWLTSADVLFGQSIQPTVDEHLARLGKTFRTQLEEVKNQHVMGRQALKKSYAENLFSLKQKFSEAGNLEPLLVVLEEQERFAGEQTVDRVAEETPDYLQRIQDHYVRRSAELDLARSRRIYDLAGLYAQALKRLQDSCTRKGEIDDALKVWAARRALSDHEGVSAATERVKAALAEQEKAEQEKAEQERMARARADAAKVTLAPTPRKAPDKFKGSDKKRIGDRYETFIEAMVRRDVNMMASLFRPELIDMIGTDFIIHQFMPHAEGIGRAREAGVRFMTGKITFGDDGLTAVQIPYTRALNEKTDLDPVAWVKVDGEWYWDTDDKKNGK